MRRDYALPPPLLTSNCLASLYHIRYNASLSERERRESEAKHAACMEHRSAILLQVSTAVTSANWRIRGTRHTLYLLIEAFVVPVVDVSRVMRHAWNLSKLLGASKIIGKKNIVIPFIRVQSPRLVRVCVGGIQLLPPLFSRPLTTQVPVWWGDVDRFSSYSKTRPYP